MAAYPRKQTLFIFIICALVTGGTAFYVYGGSSKGSSSAAASAPSSISSEASAQEKIASSGDWQKQFLDAATSSDLYKTKNAASAAKAPENLTVTDKMSREFMVKYAQLRQSGLNKDPQAVANLMSQVTKETISQLPPPKSYSQKDLIIAPAGTASTKAYGNDILLGFERYMPAVNEAQIANEAYATGDMGKLAQIDGVIGNYRSIVNHLLKTPVPAALSASHLNLLNGFSIALYNAQALRHIDTDPLKGLAAITQELAAIKNITGAFADIQAYFVTAGVPFGS